MADYPAKSSMDTGSIKRQTSPGMGGFQGDAAEFGMTGKTTMVDGVPVDSGSASALRKPRDYDEVGTKAKKFCG
ncbi:MAG: hypothetical protein R3F54_28750 [Alphaproteobacteria bacterium]